MNLDWFLGMLILSIVLYGSLILGLLLAYLPHKQNQINPKHLILKRLFWYLSLILIIFIVIMSIITFTDIQHYFPMPVVSSRLAEEYLHFFTNKFIHLDDEYNLTTLRTILYVLKLMLLYPCIIDLVIKNIKEHFQTRKIYALFLITFYFAFLQWQFGMNMGGVFKTYIVDTFRIHNVIVDTNTTFDTKLKNITYVIAGSTGRISDDGFGIDRQYRIVD